MPASVPTAKPIAPLPVPVNQTAPAKAFAPMNAAAKSDQATVNAAAKLDQAPVRQTMKSGGESGISSQDQLSRQQNSAEAIPQAKSPAKAAVAPVNEGLASGSVSQGQNLGQNQGGTLSKKTEDTQGVSLLQNRNSLGGQQQQEQLVAKAGQMGVPVQTNKEQTLPGNPQQPGGPQRRSLAGKIRSKVKTLERAAHA